MTRIAEQAPAEHAPVVLDAFVSYSRRDAHQVMAIVQAARARGRTMWVDTDDIPPGAPWRTELGTAIEAANAVVCCVSTAWLTSEECRREYRRAVELGKRLIPLQIAPVDDPPAALQALQWIPASATSEPDAVADAVLAAIDTDPERVREHTHWLSRALRWDGRGRERSLLLRGRDLRAAEDWMSRPTADPSPVPLQAEFVAASRTAERRRLRSTVAATATALVLTVALAITAVAQWREAVSQRDQAQSRALAAAALSQLDVDPERSLLLARAALASAPTDQAIVALRTSLDRSRARVRVAAHPAPVTGVAWAPDGRTVISAGADGSVAAWDAAGAARGRLVVGPDPVTSLEAAKGAAVGVAVDEGGRIVVWGLDDTGTLVRRAELAASGVTEATISGDGRIVAAGSADGTVRLWTADGAALPTVRWSTSPVDSIALSADGATVLLGMTDGSALVGSAEGATPARSVRYPGPVWTTLLSADGAVALTAGVGGSVIMWRVDDGSELVRSPGGGAQVAVDSTARHVVVVDERGRADLATAGGGWTNLLAQGAVIGDTTSFSPDGALVQVGREDGVISVWRVADRSPVVELRSGRDLALHAAFSPDGQRLLSGYGDGGIRVWALPDRPLRLPGGTELGSAGQGTSVAFTPDGNGVLTAAPEDYVRTWDARTAAETPSGSSCVAPPAGPGCLGHAVRAVQGESITGAGYSPDGTLVAISSEDGSVVIWDVATAVEVARVPPAKGVVGVLAFSSDGRLLALGDRNGRTRVVDPRTGQVRADLDDADADAHVDDDASIFAVAFTPDSHVLTGDGEGVVRLWDVARRTNRVVARTDAVFDLAVDEAGGTAAVAGDSAVVLLDLVGDRPPRTVAGHGGFVWAVTFTPDGTMVVTGGQDDTVRVSEVASGQAAMTFNHAEGDVADLAVDRTGRRIAAVSAGGGGAIFECRVCGPPDELAALAAQHSTRELTAEERISFGLLPSG